jgi:glutamate racemase
MNRAASALGVLDWGIGGLGFVQALRSKAPNADIVYLSDSGEVPYGKLPAQVLAARVSRMVDVLAALGADHVVIACNAASSVASELSASIPVTTIVAAGISAVPDDFAGALWILGGRRIVHSRPYQRALGGPGRTVRGRVAQPLSAHIEAGSTDTIEFARDLSRILAPVGPVDSLLLACTHYPAIATDIARLRPSCRLFDPAPVLAQVVLDAGILERRGSAASRFFTTGDACAMVRGAEKAWHMKLADVRQCDPHRRDAVQDVAELGPEATTRS